MELKELYNKHISEKAKYLLWVCSLYREYLPHEHIADLSKEVHDDNCFEFDELLRLNFISTDDRQERYRLTEDCSELLKSQHEFYLTKQSIKTNHTVIGMLYFWQVEDRKHISLPSMTFANEAVYHLLQGYDTSDYERTFRFLYKIPIDLLDESNLKELEKWKIYKPSATNNDKLYLVGIHRYLYRSGIPAEILGEIFANDRQCYRVRYSDGVEDFVPCCEHDNYTIISGNDVLNKRIPKVTK